eukprot:350028-Chlamydomonas_euryale.AAC.1
MTRKLEVVSTSALEEHAPKAKQSKSHGGGEKYAKVLKFVCKRNRGPCGKGNPGPPHPPTRTSCSARTPLASAFANLLPRQVVCRTTNYDRTIKTLQGVLSGLYPNGSGGGGGGSSDIAQGSGKKGSSTGKSVVTGGSAALDTSAPKAVTAVTSSHLDEILFADSNGCPHLGAFLKLSRQLANTSMLRDPEFGWLQVWACMFCRIAARLL